MSLLAHAGRPSQLDGADRVRARCAAVGRFADIFGRKRIYGYEVLVLVGAEADGGGP